MQNQIADQAKKKSKQPKFNQLDFSQLANSSVAENFSNGVEESVCADDNVFFSDAIKITAEKLLPKKQKAQPGWFQLHFRFLIFKNIEIKYNEAQDN